MDRNKICYYGRQIRRNMINYEITESDECNNGVQLHWNRSNLQNGCFMASTLLNNCVPFSKFVLGIVYNKQTVGSCNHSWVEVEENVVDLTATQFNNDIKIKLPNIYIVEQKDLYNKERNEIFYLPLFFDEEAKILLESDSAQATPLGKCFNKILLNELKERLSKSIY
jgi:hypothetical protein